MHNYTAPSSFNNHETVQHTRRATVLKLGANIIGFNVLLLTFDLIRLLKANPDVRQLPL